MCSWGCCEWNKSHGHWNIEIPKSKNVLKQIEILKSNRKFGCYAQCEVFPLVKMILKKKILIKYFWITEIVMEIH